MYYRVFHWYLMTIIPQDLEYIQYTKSDLKLSLSSVIMSSTTNWVLFAIITVLSWLVLFPILSYYGRRFWLNRELDIIKKRQPFIVCSFAIIATMLSLGKLIIHSSHKSSFTLNSACANLNMPNVSLCVCVSVMFVL